MTTPIQLIVGLGNPGPEYDKTRHNAGAWFIHTIAEQEGIQLRPESKFKGLHALFNCCGHPCRLLLPSTFMNLSGQSVRAIAGFYKIPPEAMLIAHDELDLSPGTARLKFDGGHGGHNGLRDIINHLHTKLFHRLRLGIGHPGNSREVVDYVLKRPSKNEEQEVRHAIDDALHTLPDIVAGELQKAMKALHTQ